MSSTTFELSGALDRLLQSVIDNPMKDKASDQRPPMAEQAARLLDLRARYDAKVPLAEGSLVRLKDGLGVIKDASRPLLMMMYWRALDPRHFQDRRIIKSYTRKIGVDRLDCLIAYVCDDGHCLVKMPMDSRDLELWTPPDEG